MMKVVNREDFLRLSSGTVYQKYDPCVIESHLSIKGDNCGDNDWFYQPLNGVDASTVSMEDPTEIDLYCQMRDGLCENEQMFLVWEYDDVIQLINRLRETI